MKTYEANNPPMESDDLQKKLLFFESEKLFPSNFEQWFHKLTFTSDNFLGSNQGTYLYYSKHKAHISIYIPAGGGVKGFGIESTDQYMQKYFEPVKNLFKKIEAERKITVKNTIKHISL